MPGRKASFPYFERDKYLQGAFIRSLPEDIQDGIATHGIRNSHLIAIAPTGTISLLAGNVSSGLEPIFAASYARKVLAEDGTPKEFVLTDYALDLWRDDDRRHDRDVPTASSPRPSFPSAPISTCRRRCSRSSTIRFPRPSTCRETARSTSSSRSTIWPMTCGLKGCTTFRPNPVTGTVLSEEAAGVEAPHCCVLEREAD